MALAERYAAQPPVAAQMIKQTLNQVVGALDASILHMDADQNLLTAPRMIAGKRCWRF